MHNNIINKSEELPGKLGFCKEPHRSGVCFFKLISIINLRNLNEEFSISILPLKKH